MDLKEINSAEKEPYVPSITEGMLADMPKASQTIFTAVDMMRHDLRHATKIATIAYNLGVQNQAKQQKIFWIFIGTIITAGGHALANAILK